MQVRQKRTRPYAYLLAASEGEAAMRLAHLGVAVLRVQQDTTVDAERYRITRLQESKKEDVRRNDEDGAANVVQITTQVEPARLTIKAGDFYVPMDQPLANVIAAALEPETQSSYAANRVLSLPPSPAPADGASPAALSPAGGAGCSGARLYGGLAGGAIAPPRTTSRC